MIIVLIHVKSMGLTSMDLEYVCVCGSHTHGMDLVAHVVQWTILLSSTLLPNKSKNTQNMKKRRKKNI